MQNAELVPLLDISGLLPCPVGRSTLYNWVKTGCNGVRLQTVRVGGRLFVRPGDVAAFLAAVKIAAEGVAV